MLFSCWGYLTNNTELASEFAAHCFAISLVSGLCWPGGQWMRGMSAFVPQGTAGIPDWSVFLQGVGLWLWTVLTAVLVSGALCSSWSLAVC